MIDFVCSIFDPMGVTSPRTLNAQGRIKLVPEVTTVHGIKPDSRGKNVVDSAGKGKEKASTVFVMV
ncbi:hypothetical protein MKW92_022852, partial [Papaver armeniacum]